jgi:hypothetical protein
MALIHVIPEGIEIYEEWAEEKKIERPFPLAFVLIFIGYLMVLSIDRVLASWLLKLTGKEHEAHLGHSHGGNDHDHDHDHADHEHKHGDGHVHEKEGPCNAHNEILAEVDEISDHSPDKAEHHNLKASDKTKNADPIPITPVTPETETINVVLTNGNKISPSENSSETKPQKNEEKAG